MSLALFLVGGFGLGRDIWFEDRLARAEARAVALAREAERAQLLALRAHLDPHFLFNTLNAIAEWCREDGETAERAVLRLSAMLRTVLGRRARRRPGRWPRSWRCSTRCSSCTACATPTALRVTRRAARPAARRPGAADVAAAAGRERRQARPRRRPPRRASCSRCSTLPTDGQLVVSLDNPGAYRGRAPGRQRASTSSSAPGARL